MRRVDQINAHAVITPEQQRWSTWRKYRGVLTSLRAASDIPRRISGKSPEAEREHQHYPQFVPQATRLSISPAPSLRQQGGTSLNIHKTCIIALFDLQFAQQHFTRDQYNTFF